MASRLHHGRVTNAVRLTLKAAHGIFGDFVRDESGNYLIITALAMPVLISSAGLGTEVGLWLYARQNLQSAADSAAISAGTSYYYNGTTGDALATQAKGVTATYGVVDGTNGATVTVNRPPSSGSYTTQAGAVEVIVSEPRGRLLSAIWSSRSFTIRARAVALAHAGNGCAIALSKNASGAITVSGNATIDLTGCDLDVNSNSATALTVKGSGIITAEAVNVVGCVSGTTCGQQVQNSSIQTTEGISTGAAPAYDPYSGVSMPSSAGCDQTNYSVNDKKPVTLSPGVYCGGMDLGANANVTLSPGVYYLNGGSLHVNGQATLEGSGVTLVYTGSGTNYATANIEGGATVNLTAPTSGWSQGIVMYGDPNMPLDTAFSFTGGDSQYLGGAIYFPKGAIDFAGNATDTATSCTQVISDTLNFTGNSKLVINCANSKVKPLGTAAAKLVE